MQDFSSLLVWEKSHAGNSELRQYLHVSRGSAGELDYLLLLAKDLHSHHFALTYNSKLTTYNLGLHPPASNRSASIGSTDAARFAG